MKHSTREEWLQAAIEMIRPTFLSKGYRIPDDCQVSCGFASTGLRSHHIGQCWSRKSSSDGRNQIFISPALQDPLEVMDTLVHELVHAVDDCQHKHGREFKKIAMKVGLEGPMRSASAGKELKQHLAELAAKIGPYPHGRLEVYHRKVTNSPRPRAKCPACGFTVPMLKRFLVYGPPICPKDRIGMEALGSWE
jgi:hypothetical protein